MEQQAEILLKKFDISTAVNTSEVSKWWRRMQFNLMHSRSASDNLLRNYITFLFCFDLFLYLTPLISIVFKKIFVWNILMDYHLKYACKHKPIFICFRMYVKSKKQESKEKKTKCAKYIKRFIVLSISLSFLFCFVYQHELHIFLGLNYILNISARISNMDKLKFMKIINGKDVRPMSTRVPNQTLCTSFPFFCLLCKKHLVERHTKSQRRISFFSFSFSFLLKK